MREFESRVAVVTGAASGIGRALARRFADEGMKVVLADVEGAAAEKVAAELRERGAQALGVQTDVSSSEQVEALAEQTYGTFGAAHVLCNNAGVFTGGAGWKQSLADWKWVLDVCLWGVIHGIHSFLPRMLEGGEPGHIVNTASLAGLVSLMGTAPYNAAKHGVVTITETIAQELARRDAKIRMSVLCPGPIDTAISESGRNRPGDLPPRVETSTDRVLREMIDGGMPPKQVAEIVLEGIRAERFYIFTHDDTKKDVERRMRAILEDGQPGS